MVNVTFWAGVILIILLIWGALKIVKVLLKAACVILIVIVALLTVTSFVLDKSISNLNKDINGMSPGGVALIYTDEVGFGLDIYSNNYIPPSEINDVEKRIANNRDIKKGEHKYSTVLFIDKKFILENIEGVQFGGEVLGKESIIRELNKQTPANRTVILSQVYYKISEDGAKILTNKEAIDDYKIKPERIYTKIIRNTPRFVLTFLKK